MFENALELQEKVEEIIETSDFNGVVYNKNENKYWVVGVSESQLSKISDNMPDALELNPPSEE